MAIKNTFGMERLYVFIIVAVIAVLLIIGGVFLFYTKSCSDKTCFQNSLASCQKAYWVREDNQAAWSYIIAGAQDSQSCKVSVKLLKLNQGQTDSESLQGEEMTCSVVKGDVQYPEEDISRCHGLLKEDIQNLMIQRMHNYLLQNVGQISDAFKAI